MDCASREQGLGGTHVMRGRSHMAVDPRTPTTPGRSTSRFHRPGRNCLHTGVYIRHARGIMITCAAARSPS